MKSIFVEILCPYCGSQSYRQSETLLIRGFDRENERKLKQGTYFQHRCPICGKVNTVLHVLLYVDKEHHFMLLIKPKKEIKEEDQQLFDYDRHMVKRTVCKVEQIPEKLRILEDQLDDRVIELLKLTLQRQYHRVKHQMVQMSYHDFDGKSQTIWLDVNGEDGNHVIGITYETYHKMKSKLQDDVAFCVIDQEWAKQQLE